MDPRYIGNGAYCYANSLAMALAAAGDDREPGFLECLTTVGIGAFDEPASDGALIFFSNYAPDLGVSLALTTLGYAFDRSHCRLDEDPDGVASLERLRACLRHGPVIAGPLDMGHLVYIPGHERASGADHYVVVHGATDEEVLLHDPAGYPYMAIHHADFLAAWRAEAIGYGQGVYSLWGNLRRERHPGAAEIFAETDRRIAAHLREQQAGGAGGAASGPAIIRDLAARARREGIPASRWGHFAYFALPLGAIRCTDFAEFYGPHDPERAALKTDQARAFGAAHVALMRRDWEGLAGALDEVAACDERFARATLAAAEVVAAG